MTLLDRVLYDATNWLASLPTFPALVICACLGMAAAVGLFDGPVLP